MSSPNPSPPDLAPLIAEARGKLASQIAKAGVVGASAALLVKGEPVWTEAFGSTGGATSRAVDRDTIFSLQSTSKHFAATAVVMAAQQGVVELDRPVSDYLPDFTVNSRLETAPERRMTLRLLLSHHAGFTHEAPVGNNFIADSPSFEAHVRSIQKTWLRYRVGERYAYSNLGIDLAGHVLEVVAGMPYAECLRQWIFAPLDMASTTAAPEVYEASPNRAIGHQPGYDHLPVRIPLVASGGVYSNIADMTRYAQFHLAQGVVSGRTLLDRRLWNEMHTFRYGCDYALGVGRFAFDLRDQAVTLFNHNGGGFGFGSTFTYSPSENLAWIVLFNGVTKSEVYPNIPIMPEAFLEQRHGPRLEPRAPVAPAVTPAAKTLEGRVGLYMNRDARCDVAIQDGGLSLHFRGEPAPNRLTFTSDDEAWVSEGPRKGASVRFRSGSALEAQTFELPLGDGWDFIDGPSVPPGPVGDEYDDRLGEYRIDIFGQAAMQVPLAKRNGYLYLADIRLTPFAPGLLFSGEGEVADFRGAIPTARNIQLIRVS